MYTKLKEVIVRTLNGRPDSLKESARIAFTLTPTGAEEHMHPYDPLARDVANFHANGRIVKSKPKLSINLSGHLKEKTASARASIGSWIQFAKYDANNKLPVHYGETSPVVQSPGDVITLANHWSGPIPNKNLAPIMVVNNSGLKQNLGILWRMAYHPLDNGRSITVPCSWKLQVYIVSNEINSDSILKPEDRRRPIFSTPINWDALPLSSTWTLCQDTDGVIQLRNDDYAHLGYPPENALRPTVLERLTRVEELITRLREDVALGQQAITDVRIQLLALDRSVIDTRTEVSGLNRTFVALQSEVASLKESSGKIQDSLSVVQEASANAQQPSQRQTVGGTASRIPATESKADEMTTLTNAKCHVRLSVLEDAAGRNKTRVDSVEKSLNQTQELVSVVRQLVVSTNTQLSLMKLIPGGTALEPQDQATGLDSRVSTIETQAEKMEKSLDQTKKQVASVKNALYTMDRRVPVVESKANRLENSFIQSQADLVAIQDTLASFDSRMTSMEMRLGNIDLEEGHTAGGRFSLSDEGSPSMFPGHTIESPPRS